jgi:DNA-binding GntR family transcriptional regulator
MTGEPDSGRILADGRTISRALADRLREAIRGGQLAPGTRLRQAEIAERYDVSTTPVREAFALLQREGLVTRHENKGIVVFEPTLDDLRETYLIRIPLEALATEQAVPNLTPLDLEALRGSVEAMRGYHVVNDVEGRSLMNQTFHSTIYRAAKLPRLFATIDDLRASSSAYLRLFGVLHPEFADTDRQHEDILVACEAGQAKRASELMVEHLEYTTSVVADGLARSLPSDGAHDGD